MFLTGDYQPNTARGACYLCGASKRHPGELVVDTNVTIDFEGRLALCEGCVRQLGALVGLVDVAEVEAAVARAVHAEAQVAGALAMVDRANAAADAVLAFRDAHPADIGQSDQGGTGGGSSGPRPKAKAST